MNNRNYFGNRGNQNNDSVRKILSDNMKKRWKVNRKGMLPTEKTKVKISKGNTGKIRTEEVKERIRKTTKQSMIKRFQEHPELHPNRLMASNNRRSWIEKIMALNLKKNDIQFDEQKRIGKYFPDFTIGNMIVECDGEQWHDGIDIERDNFLKSNGFKVLHFTGKEINSNIEECIEKIKEVE